MSSDSFGARSTLEVSGRAYEIFRLDALQERFDVARLPYSIKVLLENVLRLEDGVSVTAADVEAIAGWDAAAEPSVEIPFQPARVLMQDFTGVPAVVDLAAMRDAMEEIGGDPAAINPLVDVDLVIDHSVQVDAFGNAARLRRQRRARVRAQPRALLVPQVGPAAPSTTSASCRRRPGSATRSTSSTSPRSSTAASATASLQAYPDTLVGTDSHTTMVNGLGVLGWGVGGIEAEAAMLGQPISMLLPQVVGFKLDGELPEGATATDLVLTVTEMLRERGVVSKFVEFFGPGLPTLGLADRATIGNMSPEFGSTCAIFPVDAETLRYLELTGRPTETIELVDAYAREQGMFHERRRRGPGLLRHAGARPGRGRAEHRRAETAAGPGAAGRGQGGLPRGDGGVRPRGGRAARQRPRRGDRGVLPRLRPAGRGPRRRARQAAPGGRAARRRRRSSAAASDAIEVTLEDGTTVELDHGRVVIAAITSCTNTSNPSVMIGAGLLARNAVERGLDAQALGEDLAGAGLDRRHRLPRQGGPDRVPRRSSSSTWSATAAPPASATPGRCRRRSRRRSRRRTWRSARCSPATATSRAGSTRT